MRAQAGSRQWLMIIGLGLTLLGASFGFYGVWVDKDQAIEIGEARLSYDTREQDIQLPSVQNLLRQSHLAMIGFAFTDIRPDTRRFRDKVAPLAGLGSQQVVLAAGIEAARRSFDGSSGSNLTLGARVGRLRACRVLMVYWKASGVTRRTLREMMGDGRQAEPGMHRLLVY
jgi:hypothetical protein